MGALGSTALLINPCPAETSSHYPNTGLMVISTQLSNWTSKASYRCHYRLQFTRTALDPWNLFLEVQEAGPP